MESLRAREVLSKPGKRFKVNDVVVFGINGLFRIESIDKMDIGGSEKDFYVLSQIYCKTAYTTMVCCENSKDGGLRKVISADKWKDIEESLDDITVNPLDFRLNSNKKIKAYETVIKQKGFVGIVQVYLASRIDITSSKKTDRRFKIFNMKVLHLICEEMSHALNISIVEAEKKIKIMLGIPNSVNPVN